jgi:hypothetical protein
MPYIMGEKKSYEGFTLVELSIGLNIITSKTGIGYYFQSDNYWSLYATSFNHIVPTSIFPVVDAYYLDNKVDDGKPLTGQIISQNWVCSSSASNCFLGHESGGPVDKTTLYQVSTDYSCHQKYVIDEEYTPM